MRDRGRQEQLDVHHIQEGGRGGGSDEQFDSN